MTHLAKHDASDVVIKDVREYWSPANTHSAETVVLPLSSAQRLFATDSGNKYLSEQNDEFLADTSLDTTAYASLDWALKPHFCVASRYDLLFGQGTPYRYHTHSRLFLVPTQGKVRLRVSAWKSHRYLHPIKDYETYDFRSPVHPFQPQTSYAGEMDRVKYLDVDVLPGQVAYIPPYWWDAMKFTPNTMVSTFSYNTAANAVAHVNDWAMYYLQQNNIMRKSGDLSPTQIAAIDSTPPEENNPEPPQPVPPPPTVEGVKEIITNAGVYEV
jgi:hypothetical protein